MKLSSFFSDGFIAMEDLGGKGKELDRYLDGSYDGLNAKARRRFIHEFCGFMERVIDRGIVHNDVKGCNIFVANGDTFFFLDVEDIVFGNIDEAILSKMLTQLNNTIPKRIPFNDRLRFFAKLTQHLKVDRKRVLKKVIQESLKDEIVYEGVSGLKREKW
jgi:RIO-like serine/threonine protein kinase